MTDVSAPGGDHRQDTLARRPRLGDRSSCIVGHGELICLAASAALASTMPRPLGRSLDRVTALLGMALIIVTGVLLLGHGGQGRERTTAQSPPPRNVDRVQIKDFDYVPAAVTVPAGTTITFTNRDRAPHTATSGTSPAPDGVFDSGTLKRGDSKRVELTKPGTFAYYCALHPFMKATVIVE